MPGVDELASSIEILPGRFYFGSVRRPELLRHSAIATANICFSIDNELCYEPFFADFGPLNLGLSYRFCTRLEQYLQEAEAQNVRVYFWCGADPQRRANASVLVGMYLVLYKGWTSEEAYGPLMAMKPFQPFRDASCGVSTFHLTVLDCIRGMEKAKSVGLNDFHKGPETSFNAEEYEYYEQVENGDMNWILPGKFMAFSGPSSRRTEFYGYRTLVPEDYIEVFKRMNIWSVVRLNKKMYDKTRFTNHGIKLHDMYFPDGTCPSDAILKRFLDTAEAENHAQAIHCKAGLGRTGVLICCYLMKHYRFTASEVIGYIRVMRPGSIIGPQQHYLKDMEQRMWKAGDLARAHKERIQAMPAAGGEDYGDEEEQAASRKTSPMKPLRSGTRPSAHGGRATQGSMEAMLARVAGGGHQQVMLGMQGMTLGNNRYGGGTEAAGGASARSAAGSAAAAAASINGQGGVGGRVRGTGRSYLSSSTPSFPRAPAAGQSAYAQRRAMAQTLSTDTAQRSVTHQHFAADVPSHVAPKASPVMLQAPTRTGTADRYGARGSSPKGAPSPPSSRAATAGSALRLGGVAATGTTRPSAQLPLGPTSPNQNRYVSSTGQPRKGHHMAMGGDQAEEGYRAGRSAMTSSNPYRTQIR